MRARFTAYARKDAEYVVTSTHATSPDHARASLLADASQSAFDSFSPLSIPS